MNRLIYFRKIDKIIPHEKFNGKAGDGYDVLVLKTDKPFKLNNEVQLIRMAALGYLPLSIRF